MKKLIILSMLLLSSYLGYSQLTLIENDIDIIIPNQIDGPIEVTTQEISVYKFDFEGIEQWRWTVYGGVILRSSKNEITVKWTSNSNIDTTESSITTALLGSTPIGGGPLGNLVTPVSSDNIVRNGSVSFSFAYQKNTLLTASNKSLPIDIIYNPIPDIPIVKSEDCDEVILQKLPEPHTDITWYWQGTNPQGASRSNAANTYTVTQSGTYYLRGYNRIENKFSIHSIPFEVQLKNCGNYQATDENYIHTVAYKNAYKENQLASASADDKIAQTTYYDALGRPKQAISVSAGAQKNDIISHITYDTQGRKEKEYLPYSDGLTNTGYRTTDVALATQQYYKNKFPADFNPTTPTLEINAYAQKVYDHSPLNKVEQQAAPGNDWKAHGGHTVDFDTDFNAAADRVVHFSANVTQQGQLYVPQLTSQGHYGTGELYKAIVKDENHDGTNSKLHTVEEFKNSRGQVVLKRTYALASLGTVSLNGELAHDTYYVYDDFGNLTYVIPPKVNTNTITGISATEFSELCYQYKYDYRNRLVEKKTPGKGWEYIVYDKLDRPVLTQDANLKAKNQWLLTKYDQLGRVVYTGYTSNSSSRVTLQNVAHNYIPYETRSGAQNYGGTTIFYTKNAIPNNVSHLYSINYYDTYVHLPSGLSTSVTTSYGQSSTTRTKGLPTVTKTRVLGTNTWITTVTYYDEKTRPIYVYSKNDYLNTIDIVESKLHDFTGKVLETKTTHKKTGKADIVTIDRFEYDHMDRLVSQNQQINNQISERIVKNNYDDLGQLESKLLGNGTKTGYTNITSGLSVSNNTITKTDARGWSHGLATKASIAGDGYIEFIALTEHNPTMVGLSSTNRNAHYNTINFAVYAYWNKRLLVFENGRNKGEFGTFKKGDILRVERIGNKIHYKKNGVTFYTSSTNSTDTLLGDISMYEPNSKIKDLKLVDNSKGLQKVDYKYNVRGWLTNINQDAFNDNDLFNFSLKYNEVSVPVSKRLYNGNIAQTSWQTQNVDRSTKTYTYTYDAMNRIIDATGLTTSKYNVSGITYDKNGNILTLKRNGHINANATSFGVMDDLSYSYVPNSNRLAKVTDNATIDQFGFKDDAVNTAADTANDYSYDPNGNMRIDVNKGITEIEYNHLNLPTKVTIAGKNIYYVYDASGVKLRKNANGTVTDYTGNHIYENGNLQFFNCSEGYIKPVITSGSTATSSFKYVYQYTDHLGNVRLSYTDNNKDGIISQSEIIEEKNYYPFGLKQKGYNNNISSLGNSTAQKFGYNGIELEEALGLNLMEMDMRQYDATVARWTSIDPVIHYDFSPYQAFDNNPVFFADPSGADSIYNFDTGKYVINGKEVSFNEALDYANNGGNSDGSNNNVTDEGCCGGNKKGKKSVKNMSAGQFYGMAYNGASRTAFLNGNDPYNPTQSDIDQSERESNEAAGQLVMFLAGEWATAKAIQGITWMYRFSRGRYFYTVQGADDVARLMGDGLPWPNSSTSAHLGEGVYSWASREAAELYMSRLSSFGYEGLQIMKFRVKGYGSLKTLNMTRFSDDAANAWLSKYSSLFGEGTSHSYQHIIRPAGMGDEYFFAKEIFNKIIFK
ncbi:DUF6443 domain-containing protein [Tenacibaculum agarivorans]|uniref:DUF6443 domain-containing protein n=1 Tax=Tenacibaculum agarivorans TaxID=1908389 RepID=UPI00094BB8DC|nr:DUF6443 domain-containing protein [Tenacibaculum agarivorans]